MILPQWACPNKLIYFSSGVKLMPCSVKEIYQGESLSKSTFYPKITTLLRFDGQSKHTMRSLATPQCLGYLSAALKERFADSIHCCRSSFNFTLKDACAQD